MQGQSIVFPTRLSLTFGAILHVISLLVFSISCLERVTLTRPSKAYNKIAIGSRSPDQLSAEVVAISSTESYLLNSVIERAARR